MRTPRSSFSFGKGARHFSQEIARLLAVPVQQLFVAPEPAVVEPPNDLLPGGVTLSAFRELPQREVDKAVAAGLPPEEGSEKEKAEDPD